MNRDAEMYLGFFKTGICLMSLFIISIVLGDILFSPVILFSIVIWFYSFFHTNNLNSLPDAEFEKTEDTFLFHFTEYNTLSAFIQKNKKLCSFACIAIGLLILYYTFTDAMLLLLPMNFYYAHNIDEYEIQQLFSYFPRTVLGILCIFTGYHLIRGKKQELFHDDIQEEVPDSTKETRNIFPEAAPELKKETANQETDTNTKDPEKDPS